METAEIRGPQPLPFAEKVPWIFPVRLAAVQDIGAKLLSKLTERYNMEVSA